VKLYFCPVCAILIAMAVSALIFGGIKTAEVLNSPPSQEEASE
jgi:hypothetical protein